MEINPGKNKKTIWRTSHTEYTINQTYFDEEEIEELKEVLNSGWVSQGPKTKEFEEKITEDIGVKYAIAVTNCTSALHLALLSIGVKKRRRGFGRRL